MVRDLNTDTSPLGGGRRPLSTTLCEFAAPLLGPPEERTLPSVRAAVKLAEGVWNAAILEQHHGNAELLLDLRRVAAAVDDGPESRMVRWIDDLRRRKIELFGPDDRLVSRHEVTLRGTRYHLQVLSPAIGRVGAALPLPSHGDVPRS